MTATPHGDNGKTQSHIVLPQHCLGLGYLKLGEYREALKWLEEAQRLRPDDDRVTRDLERLKDRMKG